MHVIGESFPSEKCKKFAIVPVARVMCTQLTKLQLVNRNFEIQRLKYGLLAKLILSQAKNFHVFGKYVCAYQRAINVPMHSKQFLPWLELIGMIFIDYNIAGYYC